MSKPTTYISFSIPIDFALVDEKRHLDAVFGLSEGKSFDDFDIICNVFLRTEAWLENNDKTDGLTVLDIVDPDTNGKWYYQINLNGDVVILEMGPDDSDNDPEIIVSAYAKSKEDYEAICLALLLHNIGG